MKANKTKTLDKIFIKCDVVRIYYDIKSPQKIYPFKYGRVA